MPIYKTGKRVKGKEQYRVFVNWTDEDGKMRRKTKCVVGLDEAKEAERALAG